MKEFKTTKIRRLHTVMQDVPKIFRDHVAYSESLLIADDGTAFTMKTTGRYTGYPTILKESEVLSELKLYLEYSTTGDVGNVLRRNSEDFIAEDDFCFDSIKGVHEDVASEAVIRVLDIQSYVENFEIIHQDRLASIKKVKQYTKNFLDIDDFNFDNGILTKAILEDLDMTSEEKQGIVDTLSPRIQRLFVLAIIVAKRQTVKSSFNGISRFRILERFKLLATFMSKNNLKVDINATRMQGAYRDSNYKSGNAKTVRARDGVLRVIANDLISDKSFEGLDDEHILKKARTKEIVKERMNELFEL